MSQAAASRPAPVAVLGAGAWGTVLASLLARNDVPVRLWTRRDDHAVAMGRTRRNDRAVPALALDDRIAPTADLAGAARGAALVVLAVPSRGAHEVLGALGPVPALVSASKGFVDERLGRITQLMRRTHPDAAVAALSGPNLAHEIAADLPAAATVASTDPRLARDVQRLLGGPTFRVYVSDDVAGVESCGALKNVIALAAGMLDGLGLGDNARAALITRGLAELVRVGALLGGQPKTFYGLAGVGDLVATCGSTLSRNHQVGVRIARGERLDDVLASGITAEGVTAVRYVVAFAVANELDLPISREVERVVYDHKPPAEAIRDLMARAPREEADA